MLDAGHTAGVPTALPDSRETYSVHVPASRSLNHNYDPEVAAVIKSYSEGRHSPCAVSASIHAPAAINGVPTTAPTTTKTEAEAADGAFLMAVEGGESLGESSGVPVRAYGGADADAAASAACAAQRLAAGTEARRGSLFADALHLAREREQADDSPTMHAMGALATRQPRRAQTYVAGVGLTTAARAADDTRSTGSVDAEDGTAHSYGRSHGTVPHGPHRVFDSEGVRRMLEAKAQRQRDLMAAAAAAATAHGATATQDTATQAVAEAPTVVLQAPLADAWHGAGAVTGNDASWICTTPSHQSPTQPSPSLLPKLPSAAHRSHSAHPPTSVHAVDASPELALSAGYTPYGSFTPSMLPTYSQSLPSPPAYYPLQPMPPTQQQQQQPSAPVSVPMGYPSAMPVPSALASEAFTREHYAQYMWSCAMYYQQCMASMQSAVDPTTMMLLETFPLASPPPPVHANTDAWAASAPAAYAQTAAATTGAPMEVSWMTAGMGFSPAAAAAAAGSAHTLVMAQSMPTMPLSHTGTAATTSAGLVTVLPVSPSAHVGSADRDLDRPLANVTKSNESSAMNMNYVAATSVNSLSDASAMAHHSYDGSRAAHTHGSKRGRHVGTAASRRGNAASQPAAASTSSLAAASHSGTRAHGSKSASTALPPEMRYSQTNPFSTYEHNKKLVSSVPACTE